MTKNEKILEILNSKPCQKIGLDDFYGRQTVINMLKVAINYSQCCKTLPSKEIIDYLERQQDFYIGEDDMANRFYNAALNDVKYFINKREEEIKQILYTTHCV